MFTLRNVLAIGIFLFATTFLHNGFRIMARRRALRERQRASCGGCWD